MKIKDRETLRLIKEALKEDRAEKDITTRILIPEGAVGGAELVAHQEGIVCGLNVAEACFKLHDGTIRFKVFKKEGARIQAGDRLGRVTGHLRSLLSCERVVLNFLNHLSGIATLTAAFVEKVKPYGVKIYDTRKTLPLFRKLEKYAVRAGGGYNHRSDLSGAAFIKDNHIDACGGVENALEIIFRREKPGVPVIVEVRNLQEAETAARYPVDLILLDNMKPGMIKGILKYFGKKRAFEISGGVDLKNVARYARAGITRISVGALTHSAKTLDISMEYIEVNK
ncbi:carboxylating nicotinate-nucleotide diphosphorylase [Candidatus Sumerlaeota bacterium]|nr:carboxylating nicotinate-nucleotide diphosphorylase [Candidatus Sumerlaeota bacterium]